MTLTYCRFWWVYSIAFGIGSLAATAKAAADERLWKTLFYFACVVVHVYGLGYWRREIRKLEAAR